jgi:hypothetical protein
MTRKAVRKKLAELIEAYDNGDADDDRSEFLDTWAEILAPGKAEPEEAKPDLEVLVHGDPFRDGLHVQGPYPAGFLEDCALPESSWVVPVDDPAYDAAEGWKVV